MSDSVLNISENSRLFVYQIEYDKFFACQNSDDYDILALKFDENIEKSKKTLTEILPNISCPLMICGCGKDETDKLLLPELISVLDRQCIISYVTEKTYKSIIPFVVRGGHYAVLKTPIDINLAKELNILCADMGLEKNKILMNTDIGGLGYGYEYGFSIMEKIKQECKKGDEYLMMPLLSEAGVESLKTKEAKLGSVKRSKMTELCAISGALAAGANVVLFKYPENIKIMRGIF